MSETIETIETDTLLSPRQEAAMLALLSGANQRDAAAAAGVTEGTLSRWVNNDVEFRKLYATRRADVWKAHEEKIAYLVARALKRLDLILMCSEDGYSLEAVKVILKMAGLLPTGTKITSFGGQLNIGEQQVNITKGEDDAAPTD
jgi:transposase